MEPREVEGVGVPNVRHEKCAGPVGALHVDREPEVHVFVPVADLTYIAADAKPAFRVKLQKTGKIEAVAGRDVAGELALGLRHGEVCSDSEARRNLGTIYLRVGNHSRRKKASSAQ